MEENKKIYNFILKKRKKEKDKKKPLTAEERKEQVKKWTTFYRRNWNIYAKKELGINLKFFQEVILYLIGISQVFYLMCGRGLSKSFLSALASFVECLLYPNSKIVLTATTIKTAKKMVKNKMEDELCGDFSPKLKWLYDHDYIKFSYGDENIRVDFTFNNSWILILPEADSSRGERATCLVFEECRLLKRTSVDSIFMPMRQARRASYLQKEEYQSDERLIEGARIIYLTSTRYKHEWFWRRWKDTVNAMFDEKENVSYNVFAGDVETALFHGFFTKNDYEIAKRQSSEMEIDMEYRNIPQGEIEGAYYTLKLFKENSVLPESFIPPTPIEYVSDYLKGEIPYFRAKNEGEIRTIYVDFAFSDTVKKGQDNDNTVIGCMSGYPNEDYTKMLRNCEYMETYSGGKKDESILRIRELFYLYKADVLLVDLRNGGEDRWVSLSKSYYHEEYGIQMNGFGIYEDNDILSFFCEKGKIDNLRSRVVDTNAIPVTIPVVGIPERNNNYHIAMKNALINHSINLLLDEMELKEKLEEDVDFIMMNSEEKLRRTLGYVQLGCMINEAIKLEQVIKNGYIGLVEPRTVGATKDRIVATEYSNYFFHLKELEMIKKTQTVEFDISQYQCVW